MTGPRPLTVTRAELLTNGTDLDFRAFVHAFMVFARRLDGVRAHTAELIGVSSPQYEILNHLRENTRRTEGLTVTEIAQRLHCSGAFVTTEVGKLHRSGLVVRKRDPADARRVRLTLAPACESRFREIASLQQEINNTLFASLTSRQFQVLCEVFPKLAEDSHSAIALAEYQRMSAAPAKKRAS